jgi:hypothetical protein
MELFSNEVLICLYISQNGRIIWLIKLWWLFWRCNFLQIILRLVVQLFIINLDTSESIIKTSLKIEEALSSPKILTDDERSVIFLLASHLLSRFCMSFLIRLYFACYCANNNTKSLVWWMYKFFLVCLFFLVFYFLRNRNTVRKRTKTINLPARSSALILGPLVDIGSLQLVLRWIDWHWLHQ